jgi:hypothetical protein
VVRVCGGSECDYSGVFLEEQTQEAVYVCGGDLGMKELER